jgi:hypothetical protein
MLKESERERCYMFDGGWEIENISVVISDRSYIVTTSLFIDNFSAILCIKQ